MDFLFILTMLVFVPGGGSDGLDAFGGGSSPSGQEAAQSDSCARAASRISFGILAERDRRDDDGSLIDALLSIPPWLGGFMNYSPLPEGTRLRIRMAPRSFVLGCTLDLSL